MTRNQSIRSLSMALLFWLSGPVCAGTPAETVYLPCQAFFPGNSWRYAEKAADESTSIVSKVSSVQVDNILINEQRTISLRGPRPHRNVEQLISRKLRRSDGTVYLTALTEELRAPAKFESRTSFEPRSGVPECGDLPAKMQYDQINVVHGNTIRQHVTVQTTSVGPAHVVVPAGAFDTIAVKREYSATPTTGPAASRGQPLRTEMLIYAAEDIGVVRIETKIETAKSTRSTTTELVSFRKR